ncbi:putative enzyme related to lactoylglutathione lyase [Rhodococcus sp. 27YEA15]|uniref:VOC family protein n=1 Tax=Rhodococcus sp. 27YEA15 TaxID=3156259 RepID=UPI003C7C8DCC
MPARTPVDGTPCWIDLTSSDTKTAATFYTNLFGWQTDTNDDDQYGGYVIFSKNGQPIAGLGGRQPGNPYADVWTTYISSADAAASAAKAEAAGATIMMSAMTVGPKGSMAILGDPSGAVVGLWQPDEHEGFALAGEAGAPVWHETLSKDYDAVLPFYSDLFGWQYHTLSDSDEFRYSQATRNGTVVAGLMDARSFLPADAPSFWQVYFGVDDTDAAVAKVIEFGGSVLRAPEDTPFGRLASVADPLGAAFQISTNEG